MSGALLTEPALPDPATRRRLQRGWYVYDWANSAYATTVIAVFLGPYLTAVARNAACGRVVSDTSPCPQPDPRLELLGLSIAPGAYYSYLLALSIVAQLVVLPLVGALADRSEHKRGLLGACAYPGAVAVMGMYAIGDDRYLLGGLLYLVAQASFGAAMVVYNSFLPQIASPDERDRVSARGWGLGYLGGGLLLLANLVLYGARGSLGLSTGEAVRISLLSAGLWWALFTLVPLRLLPARSSRQADLHSPGGGRRQLAATLRGLRRYPRTLLFLAAYLLYNDGIQSVIALASLYGVEELGFETGTMITAILLVQFVAFAGALVLGRAARWFGARQVVLACLLLWTGVLIGAYVLQQQSTPQFFALAAGIGFVLGGSQALSRSLYTQLIPPGREAEYFSLYEITERGTSWLGALVFGLVFSATGSYRQAIVSLIVFFLAGFVLLALVDVRRAIDDAGNPQPARV
ncbi:MAG: MFS transporter [Actinomycetota bacterium]|nr:MFS transporter [Actinomycetota bacterium]